MNTWAQILAGIIVLAHCIAIFWPRKPLQVPLDENGLPMLWTNEKEESKNVACVWWGNEDQPVAMAPATQKVQEPVPVASFSEALQPLSRSTVSNERSAA